MNDLSLSLDEMPAVFSHEAPQLSDIKQFVADLKQSEANLGADPFPLKRTLEDGFYTREVFIPKGHYLAGAIHRQDSFVMMKSGHLVVAAAGESGQLVGPCMFMSAKGKQKIGYCLDDTIWIDIHRTDAKTMEEADAELFTEDYSVIARDDYDAVLSQMGATEEQVQAIVADMSDHIDMPNKFIDQYKIEASKIHGIGIFSQYQFVFGDVIAPCRIGIKRTDLGRYTNHSPNPNVVGKLIGDNIYFVAIDEIAVGDELTVDYRQARQVAVEADKLTRG